MTLADSAALAGSGILSLMTAPAVRSLALVALCSAYIVGPLEKIFDFRGAIAEMQHFGLSPAPLFAIAVIVFELTASALFISGVLRWAAALALAAFTLIATLLAERFWKLPTGPNRSATMNAFFEHLGLVGAFVLVAAGDVAARV
ncbi:MAG: DoxX family protein [Ancalomicrobiaceae bacterium]|nr:DoxX family protein [Ancalomicrobiaceae bacterium]